MMMTARFRNRFPSRERFPPARSPAPGRDEEKRERGVGLAAGMAESSLSSVLLGQKKPHRDLHLHSLLSLSPTVPHFLRLTVENRYC